MEKISVVMAAFNGEAYISEQIKSILDQTMAVHEIVIVDDQSTDNTYAEINQLAKLDPRIRVIQNKCNIGINKSFEFAIENCEGELILISDQDDLWHKNKVSVMYNAWLVTKKPCICSDAHIIDESGRRVHSSEIKYHSNSEIKSPIEFFFVNCHSGHNMMIHRSLVSQALPFPNNDFLYDHWIAILASGTDQMHVINEALTSHRFHRNNSINGKRRGHTVRKERMLGRQRMLYVKASFVATKCGGHKSMGILDKILAHYNDAPSRFSISILLSALLHFSQTGGASLLKGISISRKLAEGKLISPASHN